MKILSAIDIMFPHNYSIFLNQIYTGITPRIFETSNYYLLQPPQKRKKRQLNTNGKQEKAGKNLI